MLRILVFCSVITEADACEGGNSLGRGKSEGGKVQMSSSLEALGRAQPALWSRAGRIWINIYSIK